MVVFPNQSKPAYVGIAAEIKDQPPLTAARPQLGTAWILLNHGINPEKETEVTANCAKTEEAVA